MIKLHQKHEILQRYIFNGDSKKGIARSMGISKNTVKKYIKEYEEQKQKLMLDGKECDKDKLIEIISNKPKYNTSSRKRNVVTEEVIDKISFYLRQNDKYILLGLKKQCMSSTDIYEALLDEHINISYSSVNNTVKKLRNKSKEAFIKQEYSYGDVCEFDWGDVKLEVDDKIRTYKMAVFTSAKSNYRFAYLYPKEATEFFLDAHVKFFNEIGGVYKTIVYDNMRVAVAKFIAKNKKEATKALKNISLYYGFNYRFCNIRSGNEKGHVEKSVSTVRKKAFSRNIKFDSLKDANEHLTVILNKINSKINAKYNNQSSKDILNKEKEHLLPLLPSYDIAKVSELRVDKYSTITIECNRYSVPDYLVGQFVNAKIYTDKIKIYYNNECIAKHERMFGKQQWSMQIEHYIKTLTKKPGSLKGSLAFSQLETKLQEVYTKYFCDAPKDFIKLFEIIKSYSLNKVLSVIEILNNSSTNVNLSTIQLLLQRNSSDNNYYTTTKEKVNDEILKKSKNNISKYDELFKTKGDDNREEIA